jgi:hypothetical protein
VHGGRLVVVAGLLALAALFGTGGSLSGCGGEAGAAAPTSGAEATGQAPISIYADSPAPSGSPSGSSTTVGTGSQSSDPEEAADVAKVELLGVALAADGAYITVQFKAPPRLARSWQAGEVSVTDEATHVVYDDIPVMPVLGALFGRPVEDGQIGYVMFSNLPSLAPGAQVTVVLGGFREEHVRVQ